MGHFYFLLALAILVLAAFLLSLRSSLRRQFGLPYVVDETLFTPAQRAFKAALERAVGKDYVVYGRVRVADVVGLRPRLSRRDRERALDRLGERLFDFLVCRRDTMAIHCAVNLAPRSRLRRQPGRDVLNRICAAAGLPFVRFRETDVYSVVEIEEAVFAAVQARHAKAAGEEISIDGTDDMLQGLSSVIRKERGDGGEAAPRPRRQEPVILDDQDVEEGPLFQIGEAVEDRPGPGRSR